MRGAGHWSEIAGWKLVALSFAPSFWGTYFSIKVAGICLAFATLLFSSSWLGAAFARDFRALDKTREEAVWKIHVQSETILAKEREVLNISSARHQAELSKERLSQLLGQAPAIMMIVDPDNRIVYDNGYRFGIKHPGPSIFVGEDLAERLTASAEQLSLLSRMADARHGNTWVGEQELTFTDGLSVRCRIWTFPIVDSNEQPKYSGLICFDASAEINAIERLKQSEEKFKAIVESAADAIVSCDENGSINSWNRAAEKVFGYPISEVIGQNIRTLVPHEHSQRHEGAFDRARGSGCLENPHRRHELTALNKSGSAIPIELSIAGWSAGGRPQFTAIIRDVSERRMFQSELLRSERVRAVGQFTGGIAHDFNNVLQIILGNLQLAQEAIDSRELVVKSLDKAVAAALRGARMTHQLLGYARNTPLAPDYINLENVIRDIVSMTDRLLGPNIKIESRICGELPMAFIDRTGFENVVVNILVNASHAMPNGGPIVIEAWSGGSPNSKHLPINGSKSVTLSVKDTGTGMPPDVLERIFEPFFTTKDVGKGSGLGLSVALGFMNQSGGDIRVESEVGDGTTVYLEIPTKNAAERSLTS